MELFARIRRTRRCGLIGVGVALLEEVFPCGVGFEVSKAMPGPVSLSLPVDQDVVLSYCSSTISTLKLLGCSCQDDNVLTF